MKTRNNNGISVRLLVMILALTLIIGGIVGGSVAWLTATSDTVTNTFTVGDINITLTENEGINTSVNNYQFKMVPGNTIEKDPTVTVEANSEACWLFVKVEKSNNFDTFMTCDVASGWLPLDGVAGVYYREVPATGNAGTSFGVLKNDQVTVKETVTKADMNTLTQATYPTLKFTAYAVQKDNITTAAAAWAIANPTT